MSLESFTGFVISGEPVNNYAMTFILASLIALIWTVIQHYLILRLEKAVKELKETAKAQFEQKRRAKG